MNKNYIKRIIISTVGIFFISLAVSLFRLADIGTDPFSCFNLGIAGITGLTFGTAQLLTNIVLTILLILPGLKFFGVGTITSMILIGYISDFILTILDLGTLTGNYLVSIVLVVIGVFVTSTGISLYSCADLGISQYDAMSFIFADKSNGKVPYSYARIIVDLLLILFGWLFGSKVGLGTVIIAIAVGPVVSWLINHKIGKFVNKIAPK